jgi:hypothetical protein
LGLSGVGKAIEVLVVVAAGIGRVVEKAVMV